MKISVCLATFNEEKNIKDCLESVKWADEIIIVDGTSTDKTVEIARGYGAKVIVRENPLMFHINKQKAFEAATGDWILYLDADERVSLVLRKEILKKIKAKTSFNGYQMPRKNIIFGKWIKHSLWHPDYQLRLFRRGKAYLPCKSVHEQPELTGKLGNLKNYLVHYNYRTVSQYVRAINNLYSENDSKLFLTKKKKIHWYHALRFPFQDFLSTFFARQGYKDGLHGLVLSLLQAFSAFVTFAKIWEAQGFEKQELPFHDFLPEMKKFGKDISYWLTTVVLEETKGPVKKFSLKMKRKLKRIL